MSPQLPLFEVPLKQIGPPEGYGWKEYEASETSSTTAFKVGLNQRDKLGGLRCCVVCGYSTRKMQRDPPLIRHCHINGPLEDITWNDLKRRRWIPRWAKENPGHEQRNGLTLCVNHYIDFCDYAFFIRYFPEESKYVFINYANLSYLTGFHGKAIAVDADDKHAPFPSLFILHEMRVRGVHPFENTQPMIQDEISWQDWIVERGLVDKTGGFIHEAPPVDVIGKDELQLPAVTSADETTCDRRRRLEMSNKIVADILAATRAMPSWRACEMENTSWEGTAEENIEKYKSLFGGGEGPTDL